MSKCIGVISYFPDDIRVERRQRLRKLLKQLNKYFKLPIIIIAQNWTDEDLQVFNGLKNQQIYIYTYKKLGITKARMTLREKFLESDFDWLIMMDDDMRIKDDQKLVNQFLAQITDKEFYYTPTFLTNFCAISKEAFKKVNYDEEVEASNGNGFEDWIFVNRCTYNLNTEPFKAILPAGNRQAFLNDNLSTWDPLDPELKKRNEDASRQKIANIRSGKENMTKGGYKLTIVVPVYNSEPWIINALESIPKRPDIEIIIIDDCSTDRSYELCKEWANTHKCILLHNDENMGVGYNKNLTYSMAKGEYIATLDSDDWLNTRDYSAAVDTLYKTDYDRIIFPMEYNDGHISDGTVRTGTCAQFIKKKFLTDNGLNFDPKYRRAEDWFLKEEYMKIPHRAVRISGIIPYHYNSPREGSLTWNWNHREQNLNNFTLRKLTLEDDCYDLLQNIKSNEYLFTNEVFGQTKEFYKEWLSKMNDWDKGNNLPDGYTRQTIYWFCVNDKPIGIGKLRYTLTDDTKKYGGNIGYALDKNYRGLGYGKILVDLLIKKAKELEIPELVATVEKDNAQSNAIISKFSNGVMYEDSERRSYVLY